MTSSDNESVLLRSDDHGITTLTLNRGNKFNALSRELMGAIQAELDAIAEDTSVRVVIIAGAGKAFCAGHDLKEMRADPGPEAMTALFEQCSRMMVTLTEIPQPVIARVHGMATAAGCQLVAQCDLAVTVADATFATSGIDVGLFCSTPMVAVTRNLPRKQAMEMLMTGDFIDAKTAQQYGLVNRVVTNDQLDEAVADLAGNIASKSPIAVRRGKQLFYTQLESGLEAAYEQATKVITDNMQDHDTRAGVDAFVEKKPMPDWENR
jgi:enoyl-CoA hydratase/carnithine racemase